MARVTRVAPALLIALLGVCHGGPPRLPTLVDLVHSEFRDQEALEYVRGIWEKRPLVYVKAFSADGGVPEERTGASRRHRRGDHYGPGRRRHRSRLLDPADGLGRGSRSSRNRPSNACTPASSVGGLRFGSPISLHLERRRPRGSGGGTPGMGRGRGGGRTIQGQVRSHLPGPLELQVGPGPGGSRRCPSTRSPRIRT
jgi:hypothetical protein